MHPAFDTQHEVQQRLLVAGENHRRAVGTVSSDRGLLR